MKILEYIILFLHLILIGLVIYVAFFKKMECSCKNKENYKKIEDEEKGYIKFIN